MNSLNGDYIYTSNAYRADPFSLPKICDDMVLGFNLRECDESSRLHKTWSSQLPKR